MQAAFNMKDLSFQSARQLIDKCNRNLIIAYQTDIEILGTILGAIYISFR